MAKIKDPVSFSEHFGVDPIKLGKLGFMNPILNVDTKLFIDPLLVQESSHADINKSAYRRFRKHFENIIKLLKASRIRNDLPWVAAHKSLDYHEFKGTCLGYGAASIDGSGFGGKLTDRFLATAKEVINLGIEDPDLFLLLPLLEEGVGPDRISDLTTNIILPDLLKLTAKTAKKLKVEVQDYEHDGTVYAVPINPHSKNLMPVVLVPRDILRHLPVASDWSEVADAAAKNAKLRRQVNKLIGNIWLAKTRKDKKKLRNAALANRDAFKTVMDVILGHAFSSYDFSHDPSGLLTWKRVQETISREFPFSLTLQANPTLNQVYAVVEKIVNQFQFLIEKKGLNNTLWKNGKPHKEHAAQMLFFAVAYSYCKANDLDITPEADVGTGVVDFKVSAGFNSRVLVEIKLSVNKKLIPGYTRQLETYKESEETMKAIYLVVDVGGMGKKDKKLLELKNKQNKAKLPSSAIVFVDGKKRPSASKR